MSEESSATFIVTGASFGIGRAVTKALSARRFKVVAVARSEERLESLATECAGQVQALVADLATKVGVERVVASVAAEAEIAGIVHSAGSVISLQPYSELDSDELVEHLRIHVAAPIGLYQALAKTHSIKRMLFIDSYSATTHRVGWSAYSIVKAAAQMAARSAAEELPETDTMRVFPGAVNTRILDAVLASETETAKVYAAIRDRGELAEPEDAAAYIVALLADASDELIRSQQTWDYNNPDDRQLLAERQR
ncbi:MAG: SDR family NAD(P)-dependent oxidoreductase [Gemmatimonadetes bacterium]|jgi:short-subunit dehydrogenase|nr:SDR family NAD(P)-dependent oxidoreductase [Gemmatimonadota bacterium]MBT4611458.1 SDR family NAD(P)-dependent oxidoreductase [Gemmatimonadota bacterium]MBT5059238.1 SDR family NAD(P)-dependent oxidoreductase [Gemmatimonadota bacterium]MBT5145488.1 SDR family NAD(P)-dependent oxidoreductase [Gemmatimonadota bacterium]MBT5591676.1 SDR family NAD(P)-dependent oxidoreductase [Gemmatimonadota bacterium]